MILKLRVKKEKDRVSWRIFDSVKEVNYEFIDEVSAIENMTNYPGIIYINSYGSKKDKRIAEVFFKFRNENGEVFYTDDMVYIMNDEGKTCDTINVV